MTIQFSRQDIIARPAERLKVRSSLVRRLVQAQDDPAKQRIRMWLKALDDEKLSGLGLTQEDIVVLRGAYDDVMQLSARAKCCRRPPMADTASSRSPGKLQGIH
jgi:hypothetical protein